MLLRLVYRRARGALACAPGIGLPVKPAQPCIHQDWQPSGAGLRLEPCRPCMTRPGRRGHTPVDCDP